MSPDQDKNDVAKLLTMFNESRRLKSGLIFACVMISFMCGVAVFLSKMVDEPGIAVVAVVLMGLVFIGCHVEMWLHRRQPLNSSETRGAAIFEWNEAGTKIMASACKTALIRRGTVLDAHSAHSRLAMEISESKWRQSRLAERQAERYRITTSLEEEKRQLEIARNFLKNKFTHQ